jgi:hypothetical protein
MKIYLHFFGGTDANDKSCAMIKTSAQRAQQDKNSGGRAPANEINEINDLNDLFLLRFVCRRR